MLIKTIIVILFIAVIVSISSSFVFLLKDTSDNESRRTLYALGIRVSLAIALMSCIAYGLYTGQLGSRAPWDVQASKTAESSPAAQP